MRESSSRSIAFISAAVLCIIYAFIAWTATAGKSATADEPTHAVTGWFDFWRDDFRLCPDMPALWEDFLAMPMGSGALRYDLSSPEFQDYFTIRNRHEAIPWDVRMLYRTAGNNGVEVVRRARMMCLLLAVALAMLIGCWAGKLGGPVAAVAAMFLFCFDPNFLGHGALAKNDVGLSLMWLAVSYVLWRCGQRLTWRTGAAVAVLIASAILVKYSGLLLGPVMLIVLGLRALDAEPWIVLGNPLTAHRRKIAAALAVCLVTALFTYVFIWTLYDFRFDSGPDGLALDMSRFLNALRNDEVFDQANGHPTPAQLAAWIPPYSTRAVMFAEIHHLLPQAWVAGFIMTQSGLEARLCYLDGQFYNGGHWYYFPLAAFYKAPLATIAAIALAIFLGIRLLREGALRSPQYRWNAVALIVPAAIYAISALTSNVNVGIRLIFPVYPLIFIGVGLAVARAWKWGRAMRTLIAILAIGLVGETVAAYPNYINFFGMGCGGQQAGFGLLSDSNLDWGQDLPALAQWQKEHPNVPLYLDYFGRCDPAAYGIRYFNLPGGYAFGPPSKSPTPPCVIAIGATPLAQAYRWPPSWFGFIENRKPIAVLNGTIYLYDLEDR